MRRPISKSGAVLLMACCLALGAHLASPRVASVAQAQPKGGTGTGSGCDGKGTSPQCAACVAFPWGQSQCVAVCVGGNHCDVGPDNSSCKPVSSCATGGRVGSTIGIF